MTKDEEIARLEAEAARLAHTLSALRAVLSSNPPRATPIREEGPQAPRVADLAAERERTVAEAEAEERVGRLVGECEVLVSSAHVELARILGRREQQVADLETSLRGTDQHLAEVRGHLAESHRQIQDMATHVDQVVSERDRLRTELVRIHRSRWWRVGGIYWALQRALHRTVRRLSAIGRGDHPAPGQGPGTADVSAAPPPPAAPELGLRSRGARDNAYDVVCFPIIDWRFRFQRPQQLMKRLAARGHRVFYLAQGFRREGPPYSVQELAQNVYEVSLRARPANVYQDPLTPEAADEMFASLDALRRDLSLGATVSIVQLPFWWPVAEKAWKERAWPIVYDCMDDHAGFSTNCPGMLAQEEELVRGARLVCASSEKLRAHAIRSNPNCLLLPNACDFEHFSKVGPPPKGPRPTVGYYGAIADWFDSDLVADLAERRRDWDFVLVGSTFTADTSRLAKLPNVTLPGEQPYADLPEWVRRFDVLTIPFKRVPLTEATNPVKAYEILATGRPLVSVPLPELRPMKPHVRLAATVDEFEREIVGALAESDPERVMGRRAFASQNTWESRVDALDAAIRRSFPLVSIVIVTYNNLDLNRQCLESVFGRTEWPNFEVLVVDNASGDGTPEYLAEALREFPTLHVVLNDENEGFARANNVGLAKASGDFLVLLNNDTVVPRGWLAALVRHLHRDPMLGLIGPVSNAVGNEARIDVGYEDVADMPGWSNAYVRAHDDESFEIPMLAMFCAALRRDVFAAVGGLDERFEVGMFEDDDYAHRVRLAGFTLRCARDSFVHHWQKASFRLLGGEARYFSLYDRNRRRFEEKWGHRVERSAGPAPPRGLLPILEATEQADGTVVFRGAGRWSPSAYSRAQQVARSLAAAGFVVVWDVGMDAESPIPARELSPGVFEHLGTAEDLEALDGPINWVSSASLVDGRTSGMPGPVVFDWSEASPRGQASVALSAASAAAQAIERSTVVIVGTTAGLAEMSRRRPDALLVPDGFEYDRFAGEVEPGADPRLRSRLSPGRPVAGCLVDSAGSFDSALLLEVARLRRDWQFVLLGHLTRRQPRGELLRLPNVVWVGSANYESLPRYLADFDVVALAPAVEEVTRPLPGVYESLGSGRPVVTTCSSTTSLPGVHLVRDARGFSEALDSALGESRDAAVAARLRKAVREHSWLARLAPLVRRIDELLPINCGPIPPPPSVPGLRWESVSGFCNVCGRSTLFYFHGTTGRRESLLCAFCRTTSRYRSIARGLLRAIALLSGCEPPESLRALRGIRLPRVLTLYDTQIPFRHEACAYPLPDLARRCVDIDVLVSVLRTDLPLGTPVGPNAMNQDLEKLTFGDETFDVVVTSDVMEHVRLDRLAHQEIRRVLKPGGVYLFTVPHVRDAPSIEKVRVPVAHDRSRDVVIGEPDYHGDANAPDGRALAYRVYGQELDRLLGDLGFDVEYTRADLPDLGIRDTELFFCRLRS